MTNRHIASNRYVAGVLSLLAAFTIITSLAGASGCGGSNDGSSSQSRGSGKVSQPPPPVRTLPQLDRASEDQLGQAVVAKITQKYRVVDDPALSSYVNLVGMTLAPATEQPDRDYTFGVLDSSDVATFSAPGGYVLITRGALRQMKDESDLAGALAHEMGHLQKRHALEANRGSGVFDGLDRAAGDRSAAFARITDAVAGVVLSHGYTANQEIDADQEAVVYLTGARYDPAGYVRYLERVQQQAASGGTSPGNLATRIQRLKDDVKGSSGATNEGRFKANVK